MHHATDEVSVMSPTVTMCLRVCGHEVFGDSCAATEQHLMVGMVGQVPTPDNGARLPLGRLFMRGRPMNKRISCYPARQVSGRPVNLE